MAFSSTYRIAGQRPEAAWTVNVAGRRPWNFDLCLLHEGCNRCVVTITSDTSNRENEVIFTTRHGRWPTKPFGKCGRERNEDS